MNKAFIKKTVIWIIFIITIVVFIPFAIVSKSPKTKETKNKTSSTVNVFFHESGTVKEMDLEEYIIGVVCAEMPASFETEALKAQAVATRSYTISKINANTGTEVKNAHLGGDICTDFAHCQAYTSKEEAYTNWQSNADEYYTKIKNAVMKTKGQIITYEGNVISAVFHASNGGKTENSKDVWGGDFPYLTSVDSYGENTAPGYKSQVKIPIAEFKQKLKSEYSDIDFRTLIGNITRTAGGSVAQIEIGNKSIKGTEIRRIFGLKSANFNVSATDDDVVFDVSGHGHGVGMSQYGANYMAQTGSTYEEILKTYYTNTEITEYNKP